MGRKRQNDDANKRYEGWEQYSKENFKEVVMKMWQSSRNGEKGKLL